MKDTLIQVVVADKKQVATGVVHLVLQHPEGELLPEFTAGAHIDLHLPNAMTRQYSLLNNSSQRDQYEIAVLKEPNGRGGSQAVHEQLHMGDSILISPPRNLFPLEPAGKVALFAGGIGVTPILAMARELQAKQQNFAFHYFAKSAAHAAFADQIRDEFGEQATAFYFDDGSADRFSPEAVFAALDKTSGIYICGPKGFIDFIRDQAIQNGLDQTQVHFELFAAPEVAPSDEDQPFQIRLASSGQLVPVAADQTAMDALSAQGVELAYSCEQGICGTCLVDVVDGTPDHRDMFQTDEEKARNDKFTPCCSRARSAILTLKI